MLLYGDSAFIFTGTYALEHKIIQANMHCKKETNGVISIFGDIDEYNIVGSGRPNGNFDQFVLTGRMREIPELDISAVLTRKRDIPISIWNG